MSKLKKYWLFTVLGTLALSAYPIYMGFRVIHDMVTVGAVHAYDFPKYIIPYTPICIALLTVVLLMPLLLRLTKNHSTLSACLLASAVFFAAELLFENKVIVYTLTPIPSASLESWQMFMCAAPMEVIHKTAVEILIGDYSPTFKIHFYMISLVLIWSGVNCIYGFANMLRTGDRSRRRSLILQALCAGVFLGLCILACFTAFFRDGNIVVSPLSALLMILFFVILGVTSGLFCGSWLLGKPRGIALFAPAAVSSVTTLAMYIGEMCLLSGNLYRFGTDFLFAGLPGLVLAPADMLVILLSGAVTYALCARLNPRLHSP